MISTGSATASARPTALEKNEVEMSIVVTAARAMGNVGASPAYFGTLRQPIRPIRCLDLANLPFQQLLRLTT